VVSKKLGKETEDFKKKDLTAIEKTQTTMTRLEELRRRFKYLQERPDLGMQFGDQNKYVTWNFSPAKYSRIELLHVTDIQWGHILCKVDRVNEYLDWVLEKDSRFILLGGDCIDAGTKLSVGSPWEQMCEPQGQIYTFWETFARVRHRILGYVGGNHERRGIPTFGDLGSLLAFGLEIPYSAGQQFIDIHYGDHRPFRISLWHGGGAAQSPGARMNMLHKFMQTGDSQLYLVGHLHDAMLKFNQRVVRERGKNRVRLMKVGGAMSSSFLEYFGGYAEVACMSPNDLIMAKCDLFPNGKFDLVMR